MPSAPEAILPCPRTRKIPNTRYQTSSAKRVVESKPPVFCQGPISLAMMNAITIPVLLSTALPQASPIVGEDDEDIAVARSIHWV